jgi:DNA-directed RNA polymerase specialized sigma24 family protein
MKRLGEGDRSAFSEVFQTLWPLVRDFCSRFLGSPSDGEDAAQVVLRKVFEQAGSYDPTRPAIMWVLTIATYECKTVRKQRLRARLAPLEGAKHLADGVDVEEESIRGELLASARAAFDHLSATDRDALLATLDREASDGPLSARERKRKERALTRLRTLWRRLHGD